MSGLGRRLQRAAAGNGGGELYITPPSGNYTVGDTVVFTIREDSSAVAVNAVQANISYPTATLRFLSASTASGAFTTQVQNTGGGGTVQIGAGLLAGSVTGDQIVATVTFRVVGNGSASLAFITGSLIASAASSTDICKVKMGASATLANTTGPKMYLTPASGTYADSGTIVFQIREDSQATAVNAVQADLTYPTGLLQYESTSLTGTPFTTTVQNAGGAGTVQIGTVLLAGSVTGDQLIGTITFTVLDPGMAEVAVAQTSLIASAADSTDVCQHRLSAFYDLTA
jgi:hypothetical protein